ncbi:DUF7220 family protein [Tepidimonas sp. HKU79]|uniref:DUF7220 family protein n=1 Tax=Tepidimonas sp. HKU79 TaxID=3414505 RepID=UPI003C7C4241
MKQSRWMSLLEAVTNVLVGYGAAVATQWAVFPLFGPRRPPKVLHLWPPKLLHLTSGDLMH